MNQTSLFAKDDDKWSSYERVAFRAMAPFVGEKPDLSKICSYRMTEDGLNIERERYFVWLCESIVYTIREIRAGRFRDARRGQLQIAQYRGRFDAYQSCLEYSSGSKCWIDSSLSDAISAVTCELEREAKSSRPAERMESAVDRQNALQNIAQGAARVLQVLEVYK